MRSARTRLTQRRAGGSCGPTGASRKGRCGGLGAVFEAAALVACLDDVAVVGEAIEQRCGHFGIAKNARPFTEGEICRDDHRGAFVEAADRVEQQLSTGLREGQIAELVEDDEVQTGQEVSKPPLSSGAPFGLETVDQVDGREESPTRSGANAASCDGDRQMISYRLPRSF